MRWKAIQPDNPILRLEIKHQQRTVPRWLQWFDCFGVVVVTLTINLLLMYFLHRNIRCTVSNNSDGKDYTNYGFATVI